jgi:hypothetical protein
LAAVVQALLRRLSRRCSSVVRAISGLLHQEANIINTAAGRRKFSSVCMLRDLLLRFLGFQAQHCLS